MTIEGTVRDGVIVLERENAFPEGAKVRVELIEESEIPTLYERLAPVIGKATTLPPDAARNHDKYLYDEKCK